MRTIDLTPQLVWSAASDGVQIEIGSRCSAELDTSKLSGWYRIKVKAPGRRLVRFSLVHRREGRAEAGFDTMVRSPQFAGYVWFGRTPGRLKMEVSLSEKERMPVTASLRPVHWLEQLWLLRRSGSWQFALEGLRRMRGPSADFLFDFSLAGEARGAGQETYDRWIKTREAGADRAVLARLGAVKERPCVDILMPVCDPPARFLRRAIDSVLAQTSPNWRLLIADDASTKAEVHDMLRAAADCDPRIQVSFRTQGGHISAATNTAFAAGSSPFVMGLDHDDELAPLAVEAVGSYLAARPDTALLYSDEDKLDAFGARCDPFFKPEFAPEFLRSYNYMNHLTALRREDVLRVGGWRSQFDGAQDWDIVLRIVANAQPSRVGHLPMILYHWRASPGSVALHVGFKPWAVEAGRAALQDHLEQMGCDGEAEVAGEGRYRIRYGLGEHPPLVSIIVPTRNQARLIASCVDSVLQRTTYPNFEVLVVDNGSDDASALATLERYDRLAGKAPIRVRRDPQPFNYSAINNAAVADCAGEFVCFLNDDTEVIAPDWLSDMVGQAIQPGVGCVGAKLLYESGGIQHAGVVLGLGGDATFRGVAGHPFLSEPRDAAGPHGRIAVTANYSAVTAACLLVRRQLFERAGGFDGENLPIAFNDVDLCLKVGLLGFRNVYVASAELHHYESLSRGREDTPEKLARARREAQVMRDRYGALLLQDPYYSPHLSLDAPFTPALSADFAARLRL